MIEYDREKYNLKCYESEKYRLDIYDEESKTEKTMWSKYWEVLYQEAKEQAEKGKKCELYEFKYEFLP